MKATGSGATGSGATEPRLLLEAARVFNAAGADYRGAAEAVAEQALQALKAEAPVEPEVRQAIIGDAAALRLSGRVAGGYVAALDLLNEIDEDSEGRLHLLRALANGQKYQGTLSGVRTRGDPELVALRRQIREDLAFAFSRSERLKAASQHFWLPGPAAVAAGGDREDDLRAVYEDDPEFQKLVALPASRPTTTGGSPARDRTSDTIAGEPAVASAPETSERAPESLGDMVRSAAAAAARLPAGETARPAAPEAPPPEASELPRRE